MRSSNTRISCVLRSKVMSMTISVSRCCQDNWKVLTNCLKSSHIRFYLKWFFPNDDLIKYRIYFAWYIISLLLSLNLSHRPFKSNTIWSHWWFKTRNLQSLLILFCNDRRVQTFDTILHLFVLFFLQSRSRNYNLPKGRLLKDKISSH